MNTNITPAEQLASLLLLCAQRSTLKKAVFSKSADKTIQKAVMSPTLVGDKLCLQLEVFHTDNKATHKNISVSPDSTRSLLAIISEFSQVNLLTGMGDCEYKANAKGNSVLIGGAKLCSRLNSDEIKTVEISSNNKQKKYILDGSEPFLIRLGVSDKNGRVYDKKQAKFRQINRFLELVRDVEDKLPKERIRICDLCCGKSYLSFAVYHYFANIKKYDTVMTGIDLKSDVIEYCNDVAREVGFYGLEFVCGDIREYHTEAIPSLVISLHACDIATDIVLNKAVQWNAEVILSTPCCHHELNHNISCPELSFITDYSMLRQKLCDAATDALRLKRLEAHGYTCAALELIDPEETPKNIMLRAIKKHNFDQNSKEAVTAMQEYLAAKNFLCQDPSEELHF